MESIVNCQRYEPLVRERVALPFQDENHMSYSLLTLEFLPDGKLITTEFPYLACGGSRERNRDESATFPLSSLGSEPSTQFPWHKRGGRRKKGCNSESGFAISSTHGKKQHRHSEVNQELSDCKPSSISSVYNPTQNMGLHNS
jgi:hypothetical protein